MRNRTTHTVSFLLLVVALAVGCRARQESAVSPMSPTLGGKLYTSAWIQRSAEYKALCMQAYNVATSRIDELTARPRHEGTKPLAIVTDIDETILDNTPNSVEEALKGKSFDPQSWTDWCQRAEADTLAGALSFFRYAASRGVSVFYITNRKDDERRGTLLNLRKYGFPFADDAHLIAKTLTSNKEPRRQSVRNDYEIVMLLGDNLGDFDHIFDTDNDAERTQALARFARDFGTRFIVLPNPNYGSWEKAMTGGDLTLQKQDSVLVRGLKPHRLR